MKLFDIFQSHEPDDEPDKKYREKPEDEVDEESEVLPMMEMTVPRTLRITSQADYKLRLLSIEINKPMGRILSDLIEEEWEKRQDDITNSISPAKARKAARKAIDRMTREHLSKVKARRVRAKSKRRGDPLDQVISMMIQRGFLKTE